MERETINMRQQPLKIGYDEDDDEQQRGRMRRRSSGGAIAVAVDRDKHSKYAVMWALDSLVSQQESKTLVLIHVRSPIVTIPTPMGNQVPIAQVRDDAVSLYMKQVELQTDEVLLPYLRMCDEKKVQTEIRVIENENIPKAIVEHISNSHIRKIVMGSSSRNAIMRRFMAPDVPASVAKIVPNFCTVYVISKGKLSSLKSAVSSELKVSNNMDTRSDQNFQHPNVRNSVQALNKSDLREETEKEASNPTFFHSPMQLHLGTKLERVEVELKQTRDMYNLACEEATFANQKAGEIDTHTVEVVKILEAEKARQELASKIVAEDKASRKLGQNETKQRKLPISIVTTESEEGTNIEEAQASFNQTYKIYTIEELESATDFFAESLKIGEGSYGSVYKCILDDTAVAIKVLRPDAAHGWKQFQQEVEVLGRMRHPHMLLLLGACPEFGCLIYEYMENGSLEDRLFRRGATPSLPWPIRFRIALEVATGLLYLHSSKPKPLVHRDLKPGNILLDHDFVSKIGDVGLAKLVPHDVSSSFTEFQNTTTSGTFCYIDPEYQVTGKLGTKSDLYAFGVVLLQLLTAKAPMGLTYDVERAIVKGSFKQILDQTVPDWPVKEALELAKLALKCVEMRRKDRPDLETVVLPELQRLKTVADLQYGIRTRNDFVTSPKYCYCPILQIRKKGDREEVVPMSINSREMSTKLSRPNKLRDFHRKLFLILKGEEFTELWGRKK